MVQKQKRLDKIAKYEKEGIERFRNMSEDAFFIAGVALYLAEGTKKSGRVELVNPDYKTLKFFINWLAKFFQIKKERLALYLTINAVHRNRELVVKKFWAKCFSTSLSRFRKTFFVETKQKKIYANHNNYYGTLAVSVLKSRDLLYKINELIVGPLHSI
ncbi:MAG: hypothetical protein ABIG73_00050 [Patescibacteria group bacterium]